MKYVPGIAFGQFSRSQGSTTASHNRFGSYTRNRVTPVNPNTTKQAAQRAILSSLSAMYRTLTSTQRAGWAALGAQMTRLDSLGQSYSLTGLQAFTSINRNLGTVGASYISAAPALASPTTLLTLTLTATSV